MARKPIKRVAEEEDVSERFLRYENKAGRLAFRYVGIARVVKGEWLNVPFCCES